MTPTEKKMIVNMEASIDRGWSPVGDGTPLGAWLETKRDGEAGTNTCMGRVLCIGDDVEWIEREGGRTTVTHHSMAAPTHWRWPGNPPPSSINLWDE